MNIPVIVKPEEIGGNLIKYYLHCPRQVWLSVRGITLEDTNEVVLTGQAIHETTYRRSKEIDLGNAKIDMMKDGWVEEVKSSRKPNENHKIQGLFYCYLLEKENSKPEGVRVRYPVIRKVTTAPYDDEARVYIEKLISDITDTANAEKSPPRKVRSFCESCALYLYCWSAGG